MRMVSRERCCIVTGEVCDESVLIRFAVDPDGSVVPDVAAKLPGRGAWVRSVRDVVTCAAQGKAFAMVFRRDVSVCVDLASVVETQLARRCLDVLGLARRGGEAVAGFEKVRSWLRAGHVAVVVHASNGSTRERERLMHSGGVVSKVTLFDETELGLALGRENVVHAAVAAGGFADRFLYETSRLAGFRVFDKSGLD